MSKNKIIGSSLLCSCLEQLGVDCVFGLPGTQNVELYEALGRSSIRTVLATHELAATFMANGYYRSSGRLGVVLTIPGPGLTYALTGLAEASLDSAAVLCLTGAPAKTPGNRFQMQAVDQRAMASPIVKKTFRIETVSSLPTILSEAHRTALADEPGPVLVEIQRSVLSERTEDLSPDSIPSTPLRRSPDVIALQQVIDILKSLSKTILYVGQGASDASDQVKNLAELLQAPVLTTTSGRGVISENHPLSIPVDAGIGNVESVNQLIRSCDLLLTLGCKFSHNGTHGFQLCIPSEKLIQIDASVDVLGANYPARMTLAADVGIFLDEVLRHREIFKGRESGWSPKDLQQFREQMNQGHTLKYLEPRISKIRPPTPEMFFGALRKVLPVHSCLVTDSGLHQMLTRKYFTVFAPRGLVVPSNFQSMGFGLPAAIGAALAAPDRPVVAVIGDGGFIISGMELLTAVRERIPLTVIVFNDGRLNQVRFQQLAAYGRSENVNLLNPNFGALAEAMGVRYARIDGDAEDVLRSAISGKHVTLVEVVVGDSPAIHLMRAKGLARDAVRRTLGPTIIGWLKRRLRR